MSDTDSAQIFVGNLPIDMDENMLSGLIKDKYDFESIQSIKIIKNKETGESRGFGYVTFISKAEAETALSKLGDLEINGKSIKVDIAGKIASSNVSKSRPIEYKLFIGNVDFSATENDIMTLASDILGDNIATRAYIATERETKRPRGFGYVYFSNKEDLEGSLVKLNGASLLNRAIRVDLANNSKEDKKPYQPKEFNKESGFSKSYQKPRSEFSLYLGNLAWEVTEKIIDEMLSDVVGVGLVANIRMATDRETGKSRGFCHVDFRDAKSMERAMVELEGMSIFDRTLRIDKAQARERKPFESQSSDKGNYRRGGEDRYSEPESVGSFSQW